MKTIVVVFYQSVFRNSGRTCFSFVLEIRNRFQEKSLIRVGVKLTLPFFLFPGFSVAPLLALFLWRFSPCPPAPSPPPAGATFRCGLFLVPPPLLCVFPLTFLCFCGIIITVASWVVPNNRDVRHPASLRWPIPLECQWQTQGNGFPTCSMKIVNR